MFNIGDRVIVNGHQDKIVFNKALGTIIHEAHSGRYAVRFDVKHPEMHSCGGRINDHNGYWVDVWKIALYKKERRKSGFGMFINRIEKES